MKTALVAPLAFIALQLIGLSNFANASSNGDDSTLQPCVANAAPERTDLLYAQSVGWDSFGGGLASMPVGDGDVAGAAGPSAQPSGTRRV